ncbi:hypothetical protein ACLIBH_00635 [Virgibacillus sp. W0430]|uniref:hypothetical protein n=1 Tax=Virgibacillus sp. W0430 TaxID=3391580 RepID=UPI003F482AA2
MKMTLNHDRLKINIAPIESKTDELFFFKSIQMNRYIQLLSKQLLKTTVKRHLLHKQHIYPMQMALLI